MIQTESHLPMAYFRHMVADFRQHMIFQSTFSRDPTVSMETNTIPAFGSVLNKKYPSDDYRCTRKKKEISCYRHSGQSRNPVILGFFFKYSEHGLGLAT